jgi:hypothetical protein
VEKYFSILFIFCVAATFRALMLMIEVFLAIRVELNQKKRRKKKKRKSLAAKALMTLDDENVLNMPFLFGSVYSHQQR